MPSNDNPTAAAQNGPLARLGRLSVRRLSPAALYDAWLVAETEATLSLAAWREARRAEKAQAYATYVAALDREAQAAGLLASRLAPAAA